MDKQFSIVIPVFNQGSHLSLTLTSLEMQAFPKNGFEVVIVNDGSTDSVEDIVNKFTASFSIKYIYNPQRRGRSFARNLGVQQADAQYVVHMDADFLVIPEFLEILHWYHTAYPDSIVSAWPNCTKGIYTHYYPDFSEQQKGAMQWILEQHGIWDDSLLHQDHIVEIITPEDVISRSEKLNHAITSWEMVSEEMRSEYMKTDVAPWLMFVTRCVSMSIGHFHEVGGFNEQFVKYGSEDWELGYRLHLKGIEYHSINRIVGYHQEHPATQRLEDSEYDNLRTIYRLHGTHDPQLGLIAFCAPWNNEVCGFKNILRLLSEYKGKSWEFQIAAQKLEYAISCAADRFLYKT